MNNFETWLRPIFLSKKAFNQSSLVLNRDREALHNPSGQVPSNHLVLKCDVENAKIIVHCETTRLAERRI